MVAEIDLDDEPRPIAVVDIDDTDIDDDRPITPDAAPPGAGAQTTGHGSLDDVELEVLEFEKLTWRYVGAKESEIRERWSWSLTRYYQVLNALIDRPEAEAHAPQLIHQLQRLRAARRAQRTVGGR